MAIKERWNVTIREEWGEAVTHQVLTTAAALHGLQTMVCGRQADVDRQRTSWAAAWGRYAHYHTDVVPRRCPECFPEQPPAPRRAAVDRSAAPYRPSGQ